jgi:RimJ/RimL family protein N-acetyltransferase
VTTDSLDAELSQDIASLATWLDAEIEEWPPIGGEWDRDAVEHFRSLVDSAEFDRRLGPFYVLSDGSLVACAGFFGPPGDDLEIEIGYSVCQRARRRGIATAVVAELCERAAAFGVTSVRATVRADNTGSITALVRNGFVVSESTSAGDDLVLRRVG